MESMDGFRAHKESWDGTMDEHRISLPELYAILYVKSADYGLSLSQVRILLDRDGPNALTSYKHKSKVMKYCEKLFRRLLNEEHKWCSLKEWHKNPVPQYATVIRDGFKQIICAKEVVVGDIVEIKSGDKIPADIRIIKANDCQVDYVKLTGEVGLRRLSSKQSNPNPLDSPNVAFLSSTCFTGTATGIVIKTGDKTLYGKIAILTAILYHGQRPKKLISL